MNLELYSIGMKTRHVVLTICLVFFSRQAYTRFILDMR